jgi:branched-subunit amino acid transport protein
MPDRSSQLLQLAIVSPASAPQWLQTVLRLYPVEAMTAVPVSNWVNDARHEGPECVRPLT